MDLTLGHNSQITGGENVVITCVCVGGCFPLAALSEELRDSSEEKSDLDFSSLTNENE